MIYRVKDWDVFFEGAKSKNYKNKSTCSMPCKHGLGFKFMIRDGGPEVFGAWCAMIQILSRHNVPRLGFCTHDGTKDGEPYSCLDLEMMTDIKASVFEKMFKLASSQKVDWLKVVKVRDTTVPCEGTMVTCQGTLVPLNSDSDSNLDSDSLCSEPQGDSKPEEPSLLSFPCTGPDKEWHLTQSKLSEWKQTFETIDVFSEIKKARQWVLDNPSKRKTARGMPKFVGGWISRSVASGKAQPIQLTDRLSEAKRLGIEPSDLDFV